VRACTAVQWCAIRRMLKLCVVVTLRTTDHDATAVLVTVSY
jgi:hypothetical protein